jgi:hypothetical protein
MVPGQTPKMIPADSRPQHTKPNQVSQPKKIRHAKHKNTRVQKRTNPIHQSKNNYPAHQNAPGDQHNDILSNIVFFFSHISFSPRSQHPNIPTKAYTTKA